MDRMTHAHLCDLVRTPRGKGNADGALPRVVAVDDVVPGVHVNRFCASDLEAVNRAAAEVMSEQSAAVVSRQ
jgi:hypothetical protein